MSTVAVSASYRGGRFNVEMHEIEVLGNVPVPPGEHHEELYDNEGPRKGKVG